MPQAVVDPASGVAIQRAPGAVQSVERALLLLTRFTPQQTQWSITDLARSTGLHKSVVTRIMATMARQGFVVQDPASRTYGIGPRAFAIGNAYRPHVVLSQIAQPVMRELTDRYGHATSLGVSSGNTFVYVLVNESLLPVRVAAQVGEVRDYHANAIGKVLLAGMTDTQVRAIVGPDPLAASTDQTITSFAVLKAELDEVRQSGIAFNREEAVFGVGAVAAPIVDAAGAYAAGLSIVYPIHLVSAEEVTRLARAVEEGAKTISSFLSR